MPSTSHLISSRLFAKDFTGFLGRSGSRSSSAKYQSRDQRASTSIFAVQLSTSSHGRDGSAKIEKPALIKGLRGLTKLYDFVTYPIYTLTQKPRTPQIYAVQTEREYEWRSTVPKCKVTLECERLGIDTLEKLFAHAMTKYGDQKCLGTRPVLKDNGAVGLERKVELGDFQFKSYKEVNELTHRLSTRMRTDLGLKSREMIAIFADTREEWLISAFAAFKANLAVATVFTALADDGVVHAVNETEVTTLFTSEELLSRCLNLIGRMPHIKAIVYMDNPGSNLKNIDLTNVPKSVTVRPLSPLFAPLNSMESNKIVEDKNGDIPGPNDLAILMYTSGSTGIPKAVILTHLNAMSNLKGTGDSLETFHPAPNQNPRMTDRYLSFLPLAHIFELTAQAKSLMDGCEIGYATPLTLTDVSPGLMNGSKGDATLMKPTVVIVVPLILERLTKAIKSKLKERGGMVPHVFEFFCEYKMGWVRRGHSTPLLDKYFFSKTSNLLGGQLRLMICGGAPLAAQTQELVRTLFCPHLNAGYGLTETSGCTASAIAGDLSLGRAGAPINVASFRLVDWEDGGYRVTDKPFPRGELFIGGPAVAMGYFKRDDIQDIFSEQGTQWLKTGDIVEVHDDGVIRIIDRKKDLVKLSSGEFISLAKIETTLKLSPVAENICVFANSLLPACVAVVVPSEVEIKNLAKTLGKLDTNFKGLLRDPEIVEKCLEEIQVLAKAHSLSRYETPQGIYLAGDPWTPQSGLVTASLKLKRASIHKEFENELAHLCSKISSA